VPATRAVGAWSAAGLSRTKDFADFTDAELQRARALLRNLSWRLSLRRTRRWERARAGPVDLRPVLRENVTRGGDLVELPRRRRRSAARPLVLIGDVGGSMERYGHVLVHFLYGVAHRGARVEAFLFATRLTRVTRQLTDPRGNLASIEQLAAHLSTLVLGRPPLAVNPRRQATGD
jgi:uncharacterized protein with von Willebrand factor type A (vWA) domain